MTTFTIKPNDYLTIQKDKKPIKILKKKKLETFNEDILGLGEIGIKSRPINALSVLFDLEGFTNFCNQIDPQLALPEFLSEFLKWLFGQIKKNVVHKTHPEGYEMYTELPLLSKFMGDGILFLWDVEKLNDLEIHNIIVLMNNICVEYKTEFFNDIVNKIITPPKKLRCGIARGTIYSVGNGNDFVGPCINMSARLQKLNSLSFCFSRRGLNPSCHPWLDKNAIVRKTEIRGIGTEELVCILKHEFDALPELDKEKFKKP